MADRQNTLDGQLQSLSEQIRDLRETVDDLSARIHALEAGKPAIPKTESLKSVASLGPQATASQEGWYGFISAQGGHSLFCSCIRPDIADHHR